MLIYYAKLVICHPQGGQWVRKRKDGDTKDEKKFTEGEMEQEENKTKKQGKEEWSNRRQNISGRISGRWRVEKKGGRDEVGDESKMAPATLQHHCTTVSYCPVYKINHHCFFFVVAFCTTAVIHSQERRDKHIQHLAFFSFFKNLQEMIWLLVVWGTTRLWITVIQYNNQRRTVCWMRYEVILVWKGSCEPCDATQQNYGVTLCKMLKATVEVFNFKTVSCCLPSRGISQAQLGSHRSSR